MQTVLPNWLKIKQPNRQTALGLRADGRTFRQNAKPCRAVARNHEPRKFINFANRNVLPPEIIAIDLSVQVFVPTARSKFTFHLSDTRVPESEGINLLLKHDCSSAYFILQIKTTFQCYFEYHLQQAGRSKGSSFQLSVCRPWTYKGYPKRAAATSPMNLTRTQSVQAVQSLWLSKPNLADSSVKPSQSMNACPYRPNRSGR